MRYQLEATHLRGNLYAVRPVGQLGTMGWHPVAWTVQYIRAKSPALAVAKAERINNATLRPDTDGLR